MGDKRVGDLSGWRRFLESQQPLVWDDDPIVAWAGVSSNPTVIRASGAALPSGSLTSGSLTSGMALSHFSTPFGPIDAAEVAWATFCDIVRGMGVTVNGSIPFDPAAYYGIGKAFNTAIEPWVRAQPAPDGEAGLSDIFEWLMAHHSPSKQDIAAALLKDYHITKREKA